MPHGHAGPVGNLVLELHDTFGCWPGASGIFRRIQARQLLGEPLYPTH